MLNVGVVNIEVVNAVEGVDRLPLVIGVLINGLTSGVFCG